MKLRVLEFPYLFPHSRVEPQGQQGAKSKPDFQASETRRQRETSQTGPLHGAPNEEYA